MSYITVKGDTFESISRRVYGTDSKIQLLRDANPGVAEPLIDGLDIVTPDEKTPVVQPILADDTVQLFIEGKEFRFWTDFAMELSVDGFSQASFSAPFDPTSADHRSIFKPFSYQQVIVAIGGEFQYFGYMLTAIPDMDSSRKSITVTTYSRAAVMADCCFPVSTSAFQFDGMDLAGIAKRLCGSLALRPVFVDKAGPVFEKVTAKPEDNAADVLIKLAQQRGLLLTDNEDGQPVFQKSAKPGRPVANISQGASPVVSVSVEFNGQQYFSHISAITPATIAADGMQYTAQNSRLRALIKPHTWQASETEAANLPDAVFAKAGRMFAEAMTWELTVNAWRDPQDAIWKPNTTIILQAPGAMIYAPYEFLIRKVVFTKSETEKKAVLSLVLPGAFRGEIPGSMPWEE